MFRGKPGGTCKPVTLSAHQGPDITSEDASGVSWGVLASSFRWPLPLARAGVVVCADQNSRGNDLPILSPSDRQARTHGILRNRMHGNSDGAVRIRYVLTDGMGWAWSKCAIFDGHGC